MTSAFSKRIDGVAAGVGGADGNQVDDFAVHAELNRVAHAVGDVGETCGIRIRGARHVAAEFFAGDQQRALLHDIAIAAGVVDMEVRVGQVTNGLRADFADGGEDLAGDLFVLRVDHEDAVGAGEQADAAAGAVGMVGIGVTGRTGEHVEIGGVLLGEDLDFGVVDLRPRVMRQRWRGRVIS